MGSIDHVENIHILWDGGGLCHNMKIITNNFHHYHHIKKKTVAQSRSSVCGITNVRLSVCISCIVWIFQMYQLNMAHYFIHHIRVTIYVEYNDIRLTLLIGSPAYYKISTCTYFMLIYFSLYYFFESKKSLIKIWSQHCVQFSVKVDGNNEEIV